MMFPFVSSAVSLVFIVAFLSWLRAPPLGFAVTNMTVQVLGTRWMMQPDNICKRLLPELSAAFATFRLDGGS